MSHVRTKLPASTHRLFAVCAAAAVALAVPAPLSAQDEEPGDHEHGPAGRGSGPDHHDGLHFRHPLVAESVSPDTKLRLDYGFQDLDDEDESEMELEGEYAFHRSFAVEVGVHYEPTEGSFGETHVLAKFANYAFEDSGVLLGYGIEFGLPTGAGHGHGGVQVPEHEHADGEEHAEEGDSEVDQDVYEFAPFLNAGLTAGPWELVAWTRYAIPTNQIEPANVGPELRYSLSALLHVTERIQPLVELTGTAGLGGPLADRETLTLSPGLRVRPIADQPLILGGAVSLPLTDERAFDARVLVSAFWHF